MVFLCVPLAGSNELLQTQTPATPLSDHDAIFELGLHFLGETPKSLFSHPLHARPVSDRWEGHDLAIFYKHLGAW